ncbi:UvrD-helicase domain-containing protein [Butyrivibrio sp. M55]|uniref:UvrD-helicase domain-containing protein n=1 Tax=Butyrivibrio sp. M55 TaxID=1855323 RepID=UPI0008ECC944|nr:ATP-dependent helicase [Butyrivibrio sp. M55]SFU57303.1 DNA helicase-2 / ATP-dependent DNA helicase PcrA [Butyrivibrio sp. M55]
MSTNMSFTIEEKINKIHGGDSRQLEVILSDEKRMIVEAPAGYGKTATMVSRIAYLYSKGKIPNPKKVLALTFSVNAALKIKRDISAKLPELIAEDNNPVNVSEKVTVTNYHGFCKSLLKKYGYLISPLLKRDVNLLYAIGDESVEKNNDLKGISHEKVEYLLSIDRMIKQAVMPRISEIEKYNQIVLEEILPKDIITHTAIIFFTLEILYKYKSVKSFYQRFYPLIVIDEFQDTNCIAWNLLQNLIGEGTQVLLLGDPLQRIYGFIGAVPNIMDLAKNFLFAKKIELDKNYRFKNNPEMLRLDKNIRENAYKSFKTDCLEEARLETFWAGNQKNEAEKVIRKIKSLRLAGEKEKIAILFRARGENSIIFEAQLQNNNMPYFYGMFKDEDKEYIDFHNYCQKEFIKKFGKLNTIGKRSLISFSNNMRMQYNGADNQMVNSLCELLNAFVKKVINDYSDLSAEDKYNLILDTFENRQLKQAMEYIDADIIISTIHGAKGLEWSYVFLPDFERWGLPGYFTCTDCVNRFSDAVKCACPMPSIEAMDIDAMLDELSVFYVAVTRARKQVYVSASAKRGTGKPGCLSCFSHLSGISVVNAER